MPRLQYSMTSHVSISARASGTLSSELSSSDQEAAVLGPPAGKQFAVWNDIEMPKTRVMPEGAPAWNRRLHAAELLHNDRVLTYQLMVKCGR